VVGRWHKHVGRWIQCCRGGSSVMVGMFELGNSPALINVREHVRTSKVCF
jgi:hypothetical protein